MFADRRQLGWQSANQPCLPIAQSIIINGRIIQDTFPADGADAPYHFRRSRLLCRPPFRAFSGKSFKGIPVLDLVIGLAMMISVFAGTLVGILLPLTLKRFNPDFFHA